jgi:hypothetical protein
MKEWLDRAWTTDILGFEPIAGRLKRLYLKIMMSRPTMIATIPAATVAQGGAYLNTPQLPHCKYA